MNSIKTLELQNFKELTACYSFTRGNYITGRNFSGKSAIYQAICSLVVGYIPGESKTASGVKQFASDWPMSMSSVVVWNGEPVTLRIAFEKAKSAVKQTADATLADKIDQQTAVLFNPAMLFDLSDDARIKKAAELAQSKAASVADFVKQLCAQVAGTTHKPLLDLVAKFGDLVNLATINDALARADELLKEAAKKANEEKNRMAKTAEGVADMSTVEAELSKLPPRSEVECQLAALQASVSEQEKALAVAESDAKDATSRAVRLQALQASGEVLEMARNGYQQAKQRLEQTEALVKLRARAESINESFRAASEARQFLETFQEAVQEIDEDMQQARSDQMEIAAKIKEVSASRSKLKESSGVTQKATPTERTDSFTEFAKPGVDYPAKVQLRIEHGIPVIVSISSWEEPAEIDPEDAAAASYELSQEISQLDAESAELSGKYSSLEQSLVQLRGKRDSIIAYKAIADAAITKAEKESEAAKAENIPDNIEELCSGLTQLSVLRNNLAHAETSLKAAEKEAAEYTALSTYQAPRRVWESDELSLARSNLADAKAKIDTANKTLQDIARMEQDKSRIAAAAAERAKMEEISKEIKKLSGVVEQKRQEVVSESIIPALAVANKLANGILKGPIVFQEGVIGMQVGERFVSSRAFSGAEKAITMMGLTAGLAAKSALRVLVLDELFRIDPENALALMRNLAGLVSDGVIDQWFVFGPKHESMIDAIEAEPAFASSETLSIIRL